MQIDDQTRRQLVRAVLAVAGIAAAFGLVVALGTTAVLRMAGVSGGDAPAPTVTAPDPDVPTPVPSSPSGTPSAAASPTPTPSPTPTRSRTPKPRGITLQAGASAAAAMQQVTLTGRYPGADGVTLQVERKEGGSWVAFPTSARVQGGSFNTYVALGRPGPNTLRVVDPTTGKASNPVVVNIG